MFGKSDGLVVNGRKKQEMIQLDEVEQVNIEIHRFTMEKNMIFEDHVKIQKVSEMMDRKGDLKNCFEPKELSIGPIYADHPTLGKKEKKDLKRKLMEHFIERMDRTELDLFEEFKSEFKDIRKYFDDKVIESYTDDKLMGLVFLDGCAILQFVHSYVNQSLNVFNISNGQAASIKQDLFLIENQIPFRVIQQLISSSEESIKLDMRHSFLRFITMSSIVPKESMDFFFIDFDLLYDTSKITNPDHLLGLHRSMLLKSSHASPSYLKELRTVFCCTLCFLFFALGALICCVTECFNKLRDHPQCWSKIQSFRNVQELKTAGIKFKPTDSLRAISFRTRFFIRGQLSLPTLVVDDSTECMLLNLVAYEMCLPSKQSARDELVDLNNSWVTSYIYLLDLLIDNEEDVKDLRAADTLRNCLSTDSKVAELINKVGSKCLAPTKDTYEDVKNDIQKHYRRRCAIWTAQVYHAHFSSPWTILGLCAATTVLVLTAIQTWYAVHPKK